MTFFAHVAQISANFFFLRHIFFCRVNHVFSLPLLFCDRFSYFLFMVQEKPTLICQVYEAKMALALHLHPLTRFAGALPKGEPYECSTPAKKMNFIRR